MKEKYEQEGINNPENGNVATGWESISEEVPFRSELLRSIEQIKSQAIDMTTAGEGVLAPHFKDGVYLFHSSRIEGIQSIFESGEILNSGEIYERESTKKRMEMEAEGKSTDEINDELKKIRIVRNSGQEGISWSVNGIDAMPGTDGRIAGFVAAPESVLDNDKLILPSRPAPYELLQVSGDFDTENFFKAKKQYEVWGIPEFSFGETATVERGFLSFAMNVNNGDKPDEYGMYKSLLREFGERKKMDASEIREHFKILDDGSIELDDGLFQQKFDDNYIPPAAVYMQALIDQGVFSKNEKTAGKNVYELIEACKESKELLNSIWRQARLDSEKYVDAYRTELNKIKKVGARVEDMYFVTSHKDLDYWIRVMEKTGHVPRGILLYDDSKVVRENFASDELGDNIEMADEIGRVVGVDKEFWRNRIGMDVENIPRAGSKDQVLKDSEISHDFDVKMMDGKLAVVRH